MSSYNIQQASIDDVEAANRLWDGIRGQTDAHAHVLFLQEVRDVSIAVIRSLEATGAWVHMHGALVTICHGLHFVAAHDNADRRVQHISTRLFQLVNAHVLDTSTATVLGVLARTTHDTAGILLCGMDLNESPASLRTSETNTAAGAHRREMHLPRMTELVSAGLHTLVSRTATRVQGTSSAVLDYVFASSCTAMAEVAVPPDLRNPFGSDHRMVTRRIIAPHSRIDVQEWRALHKRADRDEAKKWQRRSAYAKGSADDWTQFRTQLDARSHMYPTAVDSPLDVVRHVTTSIYACDVEVFRAKTPPLVVASRRMYRHLARLKRALRQCISEPRRKLLKRKLAHTRYKCRELRMKIRNFTFGAQDRLRHLRSRARVESTMTHAQGSCLVVADSKGEITTDRPTIATAYADHLRQRRGQDIAACIRRDAQHSAPQELAIENADDVLGRVSVGSASAPFVDRIDILEPITMNEIQSVLAHVEKTAADSTTEVSELLLYRALFRPDSNGGALPLYAQDLLQACNDLLLSGLDLEWLNDAEIVPIPKPTHGSGIATVKQLRPIALQHPVRKLLSRILLARIPVAKLLDLEQYAFVPARYRDWLIRWAASQLQEELRALVNYDISGAYDSVQHDALFIALSAVLTDASASLLVKWMQSGCFTIRLGTFVSATFDRPYDEGVLQGDVLSPFLFAITLQIAIRRLKRLEPSIGLRAYADDESSSHQINQANVQTVAREAELVLRETNNVGFRTNVNKLWWTMHSSLLPDCKSLRIAGVDVPRVDQHRFLGPTLHADGMFPQATLSMQIGVQRIAHACRVLQTATIGEALQFITSDITSRIIHLLPYVEHAKSAWDQTVIKAVARCIRHRTATQGLLARDAVQCMVDLPDALHAAFYVGETLQDTRMADQCTKASVDRRILRCATVFHVRIERGTETHARSSSRRSSRRFWSDSTNPPLAERVVTQSATQPFGFAGECRTEQTWACVNAVHSPARTAVAVGWIPDGTLSGSSPMPVRFQERLTATHTLQPSLIEKHTMLGAVLQGIVKALSSVAIGRSMTIWVTWEQRIAIDHVARAQNCSERKQLRMLEPPITQAILFWLRLRRQAQAETRFVSGQQRRSLAELSEDQQELVGWVLRAARTTATEPSAEHRLRIDRVPGIPYAYVANDGISTTTNVLISEDLVRRSKNKSREAAIATVSARTQLSAADICWIRSVMLSGRATPRAQAVVMALLGNVQSAPGARDLYGSARFVPLVTALAARIREEITRETRRGQGRSAADDPAAECDNATGATGENANVAEHVRDRMDLRLVLGRTPAFRLLKTREERVDYTVQQWNRLARAMARVRLDDEAEAVPAASAAAANA